MKITKKQKLYENRRNRADDEGVDARQFPIGTGRRSIGGMYNRLGRGGSDGPKKTISKGAQFYKALQKWNKNIFSGIEGKNLRDKFLSELRVMAGKQGFESLLSVLDGDKEIEIMIYKTVKDGLGTKQVGERTPMSVSDLMDKGAFGFSDGASAKVKELKDIIQGFIGEETPVNEGKTKMKITKKTLQKLIKEEIRKVLRENEGGGLYTLTNYSGAPMETIYSSMEEAQRWADMFNQDGLDAIPKRLEVQDLQVDPRSAGVTFGLYNNSGIDLPGAPKSRSRDTVGLVGLYGSREEAREAYDRILSDFKGGMVDDAGEFGSYDDSLFYSQIADNDMSGLEIIRFKFQKPANLQESRRRRRRRR